MRTVVRVPLVMLLLLILVLTVQGVYSTLAQTAPERLLARVAQRRISGISWLSEDTILAHLWEPGRNQIGTINIGSGETKILVNDGKCPSLSPDRTRVAYIPGPASLGNVMVLDLRTQRQRKLTEKVSGDCVQWSPDGRRMAVMSPVEFGGRIVVVSADTGEIQETIDGGQYTTIPPPINKKEYLNIGDAAWHPDAQRLIFAIWAHEIEGFNLFMIPGVEPIVSYRYRKGYSVNRVDVLNLRDRRRAQVLASPRADRVPGNFAYSPDGRLLLFALANEIYLFDGAAARTVTMGGSPTWSHDGKSIVFTRGADCVPVATSTSERYCASLELYAFPLP